MEKESLKHFISFCKDLKVLYVEDNDASRKEIGEILKKIFKEVTTAKDGAQGFKKFKSGHFDIILTDINMPILSGLEMSKKIKEVDKDQPIIILSAHEETDILIDSLEIGIEGYLIKPINLNNLLTHTERIIKNIRLKEEHKKTEILLNQYKNIVDRSSIVSKSDREGRITFVNDKFCQISEYTKEELIGKPHNIVRHEDMSPEDFRDLWETIESKKIWHGVVKNRSKSGKPYYIDATIAPILDENGEIVEYIGLRHEITDIVNPKQQLLDELKLIETPVLILAKIADYDTLHKFYDDDTVVTIESQFAKDALFYFPNDKFIFKSFPLGHGEFGFLKYPETNELRVEDEVKVLKEFQKNIAKNVVKLKEYEYDISVILSFSIGKEKIYENAMCGLEMCEKERVSILNANTLADKEQEFARKNIATVKMIKRAIEDNNIISYYQPIINNKTGNIDKYESLVRLVNEKSEVISPYYFLEYAKKGRYYNRITDIVLDNCFETLKKTDKKITVNLSVLDIEDGSFRERFFEQLQSNKELSKKLVLELLEDEKAKDLNFIKKFIKEAKDYGVQIAVDDFGTGYSNFLRLLSYEPDILKIDGSLIKNIAKDGYSRNIVETINRFAYKENIETVAEFVADKEIYDTVKEIGIDYSQGYYLGEPSPWDS